MGKIIDLGQITADFTNKKKLSYKSRKKLFEINPISIFTEKQKQKIIEIVDLINVSLCKFWENFKQFIIKLFNNIKNSTFFKELCKMMNYGINKIENHHKNQNRFKKVTN